jgi:SAM-dependent methyltransferase
MASDRQQRIKKIMACPFCHSELSWLSSAIECPKCRKNFLIKNGIPDFIGRDIEKTGDSEFQSEQMFGTTFTGKLYNIGKKILSSEYKPKDHVREFIRRIEEGKVIVELGSGNRRLNNDIINVDLFPFPNVDLTADIAKTPFGDAAIDYVILDTVLEHVPEPGKVIEELYRILKPGGKAVCITPFIFPYHGYPKHYSNFSKDGLEFLFQNFSECKVEMNIGPLSGLVNMLSEYLAVVCGGSNKLFYTCFKGIGLLPIFYLKYLDKLWKDPAGRVVRIASHLCAIVTK